MMQEMPNKLVEWLKFEEGFMPRPYRDTVGVRTVGYGRNLVAHPSPGRNWTARPCTKEEAEGWLREEAGEMYVALCKAKPIVRTLDDVRAAALMNMAYQLGVSGLLQFRLMWTAVEAGDFAGAAANAKDSRWARQTPKRAKRVCKALATGEWPKEVA